MKNALTLCPAATAEPVAPAMSSRTIAEITGKRHDHVLRDIRLMLDKLKKTQPTQTWGVVWGQYRDSLDRPQVEVMLSKTEVLTLISGYHTIDRFKIIRRLEDLEKAARSQPTPSPAPALPNFSNPVLAARAWADAMERGQNLLTANTELTTENAELLQRTDALATKAAVADRIADATGLTDMLTAAKSLGLGRQTLFDILREEGVFMASGLPYQRFMEMGYFNVIERVWTDVHSVDHISAKSMATARGMIWLAKLMARRAKSPEKEVA